MVSSKTNSLSSWCIYLIYHYTSLSKLFFLLILPLCGIRKPVHKSLVKRQTIETLYLWMKFVGWLADTYISSAQNFPRGIQVKLQYLCLFLLFGKCVFALRQVLFTANFRIFFLLQQYFLVTFFPHDAINVMNFTNP